MALYRVRLTLARNEDYPAGSAAHGYDLVVPLDKAMRLDAEGWRAEAKKCVVRRFWEGEPDQVGLLRHIGRGWAIDYDAKTIEADEPFFKLDRHEFQNGEYISVTEQDGEMQTFRIVSVEPV
ncbi:MAG: hypothetical protein WA943_04305 [Parvibaculum sp.]|uniref:hypothetical protein n=1 Tax=Parvibaculum sp. TaxID=2024848 RepID=UPI003C789B83